MKTRKQNTIRNIVIALLVASISLTSLPAMASSAPDFSEEDTSQVSTVLINHTFYWYAITSVLAEKVASEPKVQNREISFCHISKHAPLHIREAQDFPD